MHIKQLETIGDRVKARRLAMDMSQEDLAKALGYKSKSSIAKIETGNGDVPRSNPSTMNTVKKHRMTFYAIKSVACRRPM